MTSLANFLELLRDGAWASFAAVALELVIIVMLGILLVETTKRPRR